MMHSLAPLKSVLLRETLMQTTILLVDDHPIFRESLRNLICNDSEVMVIGEAGNGIDAVRLAAELQPDLVIMDLTMPGMNGIDATRKIRKLWPGMKILALSMESDRFFVVEILRAGASGYMLKDTAFAELVEAIHFVARGETYLPRKIASLLVKDFLHCMPEESTSVYERLTSDEKEVIRLMADGKCIKEIAYALSSNYKAVEKLRCEIMQKLQLFTVAELTKYAVRHGLTSLG